MKKYLAQMLKVAGDLRRPPAKFENPGNLNKNSNARGVARAGGGGWGF